MIKDEQPNNIGKEYKQFQHKTLKTKDITGTQNHKGSAWLKQEDTILHQYKRH